MFELTELTIAEAEAIVAALKGCLITADIYPLEDDGSCPKGLPSRPCARVEGGWILVVWTDGWVADAMIRQLQNAGVKAYYE